MAVSTTEAEKQDIRQYVPTGRSYRSTSPGNPWCRIFQTNRSDTRLPCWPSTTPTAAASAEDFLESVDKLREKQRFSFAHGHDQQGARLAKWRPPKCARRAAGRRALAWWVLLAQGGHDRSHTHNGVYGCRTPSSPYVEILSAAPRGCRVCKECNTCTLNSLDDQIADIRFMACAL